MLPNLLALVRHCEERSDEAIQSFLGYGLLRYARNDGFKVPGLPLRDGT